MGRPMCLNNEAYGEGSGLHLMIRPQLERVMYESRWIARLFAWNLGRTLNAALQRLECPQPILGWITLSALEALVNFVTKGVKLTRQSKPALISFAFALEVVLVITVTT